MHSVLAFRSLRGGAAALSTEAAPVPGYLHSRSAGRARPGIGVPACRLDLQLGPGPKGRNQPVTHSGRQRQASSVFKFYLLF